MASVGRGLSIRGHFSTRLSVGQMFSEHYITILNVRITLTPCGFNVSLFKGECKSEQLLSTDASVLR